MSQAQESYASLVNAIDAFGRYVPQNVVRGLLEGSVRPVQGHIMHSVFCSWIAFFRL